jgi:hypothetical protein
VTAGLNEDEQSEVRGLWERLNALCEILHMISKPCCNRWTRQVAQRAQVYSNEFVEDVKQGSNEGKEH